jgi:RNase H-fold protein (predicted Holliday junction resolvase)
MIRNTKRILSLEIRRHRVGYAVLEGRKRLLEYGAGTYTSRSSILTYLERIIATYKPEMIVVRRPKQRNLSDRRATIETLKQVRAKAEERAIPIQFVTDDEVRLAFQQDAPRNKDGIATRLSRIAAGRDTHPTEACIRWHTVTQCSEYSERTN